MRGIVFGMAAALAIAAPWMASGEEDARANVLTPLVGKMEEVESDLVREETGEVTQTKVQEILAALDRLIDELDPPRKEIPPPRPNPDEGTLPPPPLPGEEIPVGWGFPIAPLTEDIVIERGGEGPLPPFRSQKGGWGRRVPIASEKYAVQRAAEDRMPPEYAPYVAVYFRTLTAFASRD